MKHSHHKRLSYNSYFLLNKVLREHIYNDCVLHFKINIEYVGVNKALDV